MLHRQKLLNSENHTRHELGTMPGYGRTDRENALIQVLEDVLYDDRIMYFREFVRSWQRHFPLPRDVYDGIMSNDDYAWFNVYVLICNYRRLVHRWEHAANQLMKRYNISAEDIPNGTACIDE